MKKIKAIIVVLIGILTLTVYSCKKENPSQTDLNIVVKSDFAKALLIGSGTNQNINDPGEIKGSASASAVTLETFLINIEDIEFKIDDDYGDNMNNDDDYDDCFDDCDDDKGTYDDDDDDGQDDEFEVKGPILVDLLSPEVSQGLTIATSNLPNGFYEEVEVELDKYTKDPAEKIYNHTVLIEGQINGNKMKMWFNDDYDFEIDFPDSEQNIALSGDDLNVYIDFHINKMLETLNSIDFSGAKDGNGNGIIEIGPNNIDGNHDFANYFIRAIFKSFNLDDIEDDD